MEQDKPERLRSSTEQHVQTIVVVVVGALLLWAGSTLVDVRTDVSILKVQNGLIQTQIQAAGDDRFRGTDWRREKEIIDDRFRRVETEVAKHRDATEPKR